MADNPLNLFQRLVRFYSDREYYRLLFRLAFPIAFQQLILSSLNMVAVVMIGQLGEGSVAAVGLANQIWFLLNLVIFGVVSGAAMFIAQLWGKHDVANIRRVLGLTIKLSVMAAVFFSIIAGFFPEKALQFYTKDLAVINTGSQYLQVFCWSYVFFAITASYGAALRSTGNVRLPLIVSTSALGLNILLAYILIFGWDNVGIPALGTNGAAVAGLIARILECIAMVALVYRDQNNPVAVSTKDILDLDFNFMARVMKPVLPVIANEILWSLGITTYNAIYGHIGTQAVAAINIVSTIEQMAFVFFLGLGTATAIMVGHQIGQGEVKRAYTYAGRSLSLQIFGASLIGLLVYLFAGNIFNLYQVSPRVILDARNILAVLALGMWIRASNHVIIIGILRSGGDTLFSLFLDGLVIWFIGVPAAAAGAFLFDLPIHLVYALTLCEEATKFLAGLWRYFSKKWIRDLTVKVANISEIT